MKRLCKTLNHCFNPFGLLFLTLFFASFSCEYTDKQQETKVITDLNEYRELRNLKLSQSRPVIHNNDGCDAYLYPLETPSYIIQGKNQPRPGNVVKSAVEYPFSISNFLNLRSAGLKGSDVSTISYTSIASSFGQFTHNTKVGEFLTLTHQRPGCHNVVPEFVKLGTDPLEVTCKFAHENGFEFFWSNRINDCHDSGHTPENPYERFSKLKTEHPEYLFGACQEKLPYGRWSAVDFSHKEIRDLCVQYYTEVCENYDVDGIEMDFFRHLYLFKNVARGEVATKEQLDLFTDMLTQIREMTERVGMKKGKPILLLVRIPDSIEYCRGVGIDIVTWMSKGLVDIIVGSDYFRLNQWKYIAALGHKYKVKAYAGLSESRITNEHPMLERLQNPVYRARSAAAWQAGVDGLYIFNEYNTRSLYLSQIGSADQLTNKNNLYFATYRNASPGSYLKNGSSYKTIPLLTPSNTIKLNNQTVTYSLEFGDESKQAKVALILYTQGGIPGAIRAYLNNSPVNFRKSTGDGLSIYEIPQESVKPGENSLKLIHDSAQGPVTLMDLAVLFYRDKNDPDIKSLATICF